MPFHLHSLDDGSGWADAQCFNQRVQLAARAFRHDKNAAVRHIAHITHQMQSIRAALRVPAKIDALHDAAHADLRARGGAGLIALHSKIIAQVMKGACKRQTAKCKPNALDVIIARMTRTYITLAQARALYAGADSAHDFEHILRVTHMAQYLAQREGAAVEIVRAAALLHDIARHTEDHVDATLDHAEVSARDAKKLVLKNGASETFGERVAAAIRSHRFRGATQPQSLEAKILFDADKLDAIGAIGVARAYALCGAFNQKLYSEPKENKTATRQQHNAAHTPVDEYHVKLKHLRGRFFTPTAKKIAAERDAFMRAFFEQLAREARGEL